jgi:Cation efflux family
VGTLFLSLTLLATGLSVGAWSYNKMHEVLRAQQFAKVREKNCTNFPVSISNTMNTSLALDLYFLSDIMDGQYAYMLILLSATEHFFKYDNFVYIIQNGVQTLVQIPSWPALALAAVSIAAKEWLFQITKKVGDALNSQILVANAWHHRSDAFSSILSLISIAAAMSLPGFLIADSAAGMLVAGMICLTGSEILSESVKQLTDTSDKSLTIKIESLSTDVAGVLGVTQIRAR